MDTTEKQKIRISKIVQYVGEKTVIEYLNKFYKNADITCLTRKQAQKIITGLGDRVPRKPILKVFGRDVF